MAMAPTSKVVLGSIAFVIFWVLAVFPAVPFLPIGRTAGSLLGAMLMVIFRVMSPDQAYAAIDLPILGLLFGTMVVSFYLEQADMFKYLGRLLTWRSRGGKDLLCRICLISAVSSAFFTNDTSCVVLTEFVLKIARQNNLPPQPFLLALASSANIGSSATPIGNPQNLVIAIQSKISFGEFLVGIIPAMLLGVVVNVCILLCLFWKLLSVEKDVELAAVAEFVAEDGVHSHRFSPATMSHVTSLDPPEWSPRLLANRDPGHLESLKIHTSISENDIQRQTPGRIESVKTSNASKDATGSAELAREEVVTSRQSEKGGLNDDAQINCGEDSASVDSSDGKEGVMALWNRWKRLFWKTCVYLVTVGMLVSLLVGLNMSWTAVTAALALVVIDFKDARPCLEKSFSVGCLSLLLASTKRVYQVLSGTSWSRMRGSIVLSGVALLAIVILLLSNVASNVPTVLLLGARVAASAAMISQAEEKKAWLILAWVSTVAGNLSLLGSAANLIVCEQARRSQLYGYNLSFWTHLQFGVPSTLIVTAIGLPLIRG